MAEYKQKYVWTDSGVCDITYLWKAKRFCRTCGTKKNISKVNNVWTCMSCTIGDILNKIKQREEDELEYGSK